MERYEAYKDSGVEWIGEIPAGWVVARLGNCLALNQGGVWGDDPSNGEGTVVLRSTEQTIDGNWRIENPAIRNLQNEPHIEEKMLAVDDLLVTKSSGSELHIGKTTIVDEGIASLNCTYSNFMQRLRTNERLHARLCWYLLNSDLARSQYCYLQNSTSGIGNLNADTIADIHIPIPPHAAQNHIIDYLDAKTAEVDALVADCEREVGLLREYRKAVVSEAVTKGLDPDAPMKDSGVEWIGEMPEGWAVQPSKTLFSEGKELRHPDDEQCAATQKYGIIPQAQYIALENQRMVAADKNLDSWKHVEPGDFVISLRSFQGGLELSTVTGCVTWHYIVLKKSYLVDTGYYKYLFKTQRYIESLQRTCTYIRDGQDLRYSNFIQVPLPLPEIDEQREIGIYLDSKTAEIDSLVDAKQQMADKLREYRKSLITEAVTGKFKVPGVK